MLQNNKLTLPLFHWFVSKFEGKPVSNTYTGSCGTDPNRGCMAVTTFHYKVFVKDVGQESSRIICECFVREPKGKDLIKKKFETTDFECSPHGLTQATEWLNEKYSDFLNRKDK